MTETNQNRPSNAGKGNRPTAVDFAASFAAALLPAALGLALFGFAPFAGAVAGGLAALFTLVSWAYILSRLLAVRGMNAATMTTFFLCKTGLMGLFIYLVVVKGPASPVGFLAGFLAALFAFGVLMAIKINIRAPEGA